jgi:serine/threonine protein kinase
MTDDFRQLLGEVTTVVQSPTWDEAQAAPLTGHLKDYAAGKSLELASIARKFLDACTLRSTIANEEGDSHLFVEFPVVFRGHSLGDGPFGAVNKGRWKEMDVAVKTFRPEVIDSDADGGGIKSVIRELICWKAMSGSDYVWKLLGFSLHVDIERRNIHYVIISELAQGNLVGFSKTLRAHNDAHQIGECILQIAKGLKTLHDRGIVHGNLHATNILQWEGKCYLADLEIAKQPPRYQQSFTFAPVFALQHWVAPELGKPGAHVDKRTDIFSFACVIYELFSGQLPSQSKNLAIRHFHSLGFRSIKYPGRPQFIGSSTWDNMWNLLKKCWSKSPASRPTADSIVDILRKDIIPDLPKG